MKNKSKNKPIKINPLIVIFWILVFWPAVIIYILMVESKKRAQEAKETIELLKSHPSKKVR